MPWPEGGCRGYTVGKAAWRQSLIVIYDITVAGSINKGKTVNKGKKTRMKVENLKAI